MIAGNEISALYHKNNILGGAGITSYLIGFHLPRLAMLLMLQYADF